MMQTANGRPVTYGSPIQVRAFTFLKRRVLLSTGQQFDAWVYQDDDGVRRAPRWVRFALEDAYNKYIRRIGPLLEESRPRKLDQSEREEDPVEAAARLEESRPRKLDQSEREEDPVEAAARAARIEQAQNQSQIAWSDYLTDAAMVLLDGIDETTANAIDDEELDSLFTQLGYFTRPENRLRQTGVVQESSQGSGTEGEQDAVPLSGDTSQPDSPPPTPAMTT